MAASRKRTSAQLEEIANLTRAWYRLLGHGFVQQDATGTLVHTSVPGAEWNNAVLCANYSLRSYIAMSQDRHRVRVFKLGIIAFFVKLLLDPSIDHERPLVLIEM